MTQAFHSRNVLGTNRSTLEVTSYTVHHPTSATIFPYTTLFRSGTISAAALDINATAESRGYNGTTSSSATPTTSGLFRQQKITRLNSTHQTSNDAGINGSTLEVTGYTVNDGNSGANYTVTTHTA